MVLSSHQAVVVSAIVLADPFPNFQAELFDGCVNGNHKFCQAAFPLLCCLRDWFWWRPMYRIISMLCQIFCNFQKSGNVTTLVKLKSHSPHFFSTGIFIYFFIWCLMSYLSIFNLWWWHLAWRCKEVHRAYEKPSIICRLLADTPTYDMRGSWQGLTVTTSV